jgi:hypothetical protein
MPSGEGTLKWVGMLNALVVVGFMGCAEPCETIGAGSCNEQVLSLCVDDGGGSGILEETDCEAAGMQCFENASETMLPNAGCHNCPGGRPCFNEGATHCRSGHTVEICAYHGPNCLALNAVDFCATRDEICEFVDGEPTCVVP